LKIDLCVNISIDIPSPSLEHLIKGFAKAVRSIFEQVVHKALFYYAHEYKESGELARIIGCLKIAWKTSTGNEMTRIATPFGNIKVPQLQVRDKATGRRYYITRPLLGIEKRKRIPMITQKYLGLMGALAPLRVVNKFLSLMSGVTYSLMSIVRAIRDTASTIVFGVDEKETCEFEADGTGVPIISAGKRGKELEILAQRTQRGRIRIAGMAISEYKKGWGTLFEPLKAALSKFKEIFLVTDGDTSPLKGLEGIKVILQRCLFHIPHEMKYTLWKDKVKRKSKLWRIALARIFEITTLKRIRDDPGIAFNLIKWKRNMLTRLIHFCEKHKWKATAVYLTDAKPDIFKGIERRISGGTTSMIERVMRTVNQRINIAQWSTKTALAVSKLR
jgi:hypothetical protein